MKAEDIKLGMKVYHRDVYDCREELTVVGIRFNEVELMGDYSGGTHNVVQTSWLPLDGLTTIYNYEYKAECRKKAIEHLQSSPCDTLANMILELTKEVELNPIKNE